MIYTDRLLTSALLIFAPAIGFVVASFTKLISKGTRRAHERIADLLANLSEVIGGVRIVKSFAIVPQESLLFSGTVADKIRYGRLDATGDRGRCA